MFRTRLSGAAVAAMAAVVLNAGGAAAEGRPTVLVDPVDLYRTCVTPGSPGTNYPNTEVEPRVAANPANPNNLIGVWQQDRWSTGGARGTVAGWTMDGGLTWSQSPVPFTLCSPGGIPFGRASDPWVSIGPDGRAYAIALVSCFSCSGIITSTSTDGGRTWTSPSIVINDTNPNIGNDKPSITADPVHAGTAFAVWDRIDLRRGGCHTPGMLSITHDGGQTWSAPRAISDTASFQGVLGAVIVIDPKSGALYDLFQEQRLDATCSVASQAQESMITSTDGGTTWSAPSKVGDLLSVAMVNPNTGATLRTGTGLPSVAIDPATGRLYAGWEDARFNGGHYNEVALVASGDGGAHWSGPVRVNTPTGRPAFTPTVAVNSAGLVGVSYFDLRGLPPGDTTSIPTQAWLARLPAGGGAVQSTVAITPRAFDLATAPQSRGLFLGDYQGLAATGLDFHAFYARTTGVNTNPTGIYDTALPD